MSVQLTLEVVAIVIAAVALVVAGVIGLVVTRALGAVRTSLDALDGKVGEAGRWHDTERARSLEGAVSALETAGELTAAKLVGLPTAADIVGLKGKVDTLQATVEHSIKLQERTDIALDRVEQYLLERKS